jgi:hypothetical protein
LATPIAWQRLTTSSGVIDIPIYSITDPNIVDKSFRIQTGNGIGCFDLITPTSATPFKIATSGGIKGINLVVT